MFNFFTYDFGYSSSLRFAMLVPFVLAVGVAALAVLRSWSRWVYIPMVVPTSKSNWPANQDMRPGS